MVLKNSRQYSRVVFAAMSKRNFYLREHIIKYVLECGYTPTCAFMMFSYFLLDTVDRKSLISANDELIRRSDEIWVFGLVSDGVAKEIELAKKLSLPVRYFDIDSRGELFKEIEESRVKLEV